MKYENEAKAAAQWKPEIYGSYFTKWKIGNINGGGWRRAEAMKKRNEISQQKSLRSGE